MKYNQPSKEAWRALYEAAIAVKALEPWTFMEETNVFGLRNPETGEVGYISVMGTAGEHYAMALYLGARGFQGFWAMQEKGSAMRPEDVLNTPQLQASFEDRELIEKEDHKIIKDLELKFRGRNAWPRFRSFGPGLYPWLPDDAEARFLTVGLRQLLEVAPRFKNDPDLLYDEDDDTFLVRVPHSEDGEVVWEDEMLSAPEPVSMTLTVRISNEVIDKLRRVPQQGQELAADLYIMPVLIGKKGERPRSAHSLLVVNRRTGMVLGHEAFDAQPSVESMYERIPETFCRLLARIKLRPARVWTSSIPLAQVLEGLIEPLNIEVRYRPYLEEIEQVKAELNRYMR